MDQLKQELEKDFGFKIQTWDVIKHIKNSSFVARVVTNEGIQYALKSLYIKPERQLFIATSEYLLSQRGVRLALPIPTLNGDLYMIYNRVPYVLYQWIEGKGSRLQDRNDLESIVEVMAQLHHASRELDYPPDVKIYDHLHWKKEYKQRLKSLEVWFSKHKKSKSEKDVIINSNLSFFYKIGKKSLKELQKSSYQDYMKDLVSAKSLVHGDLHHKNLIYKENVLTLIDFEDVRYDLPSKDLLRIYSMYTKKKPFEKKTFRSMMKIYNDNNPLSPEVKSIVSIDLLFPHIFERMLRKKKYARMSIDQLNFMILQEKKKSLFVYNHYFKKQRHQERGNILD
ncbi:CotS family spore coat protein [Paenibacillus sp. FA6]|uniref:CotS family spore coat protein n=1 Tax=Paenibacillus sp. FA6 TaxID=3413029 RepID=UPI003F657A21